MATTKKRVRKNPMRGRILSAALSLGLLAAAGMIGMYTVGRNERRQQEEQLAKRVEEAERAFEAAQKQKEQEQREQEEEQTQETASSNATAEFQKPQEEMQAELESEFATVEPEPAPGLSEEEQAALDAEADAAAMQDAVSQEIDTIVYSFSPDTDKLLWPISGNIILDYNMDQTVYFATLDQYKYNPAVIIQGQVNQEVLCGASGQVTKIQENDELGTMVTVDFGNGYEGVYGQLKEVAIQEGSPVQAGVKLGVISEPSRYFTKEGANVYFQVLKDGEPVDPKGFLQ